MNPLVKHIVDEWGLTTMSVEQQHTIIDRIGSLVYQAVLEKTRIILAPVDQIELDLLIEEQTTTPADVLLFLEQKIPNFQSIIKEEVEKIKSKVLATRE